MRVIEAIFFEPVGTLAEFTSERTTLYEDAIPALTELKAMGIKLFIASSLSASALNGFLIEHRLIDFFSGAWNRDTPPESALARASVNPINTMFLTDTEEGINTAKSLGVNSILMMNDPDMAKRLAMLEPAGGIVSLLELPDFIRFVAAENL
jgi:phosphoglycolate phosphatase-like HAD superfamily hydrolase